MRIGSIEAFPADARPRVANSERAHEPSATSAGTRASDARRPDDPSRPNAIGETDAGGDAKGRTIGKSTGKPIGDGDRDRVELSSKNPLKPEENRPVGPGLPTDIDLAKVDEVREAIREGRFPVNAAAVADRLIESAADLVMLASHPRQ